MTKPTLKKKPPSIPNFNTSDVLLRPTPSPKSILEESDVFKHLREMDGGLAEADPSDKDCFWVKPPKSGAETSKENREPFPSKDTNRRHRNSEKYERRNILLGEQVLGLQDIDMFGVAVLNTARDTPSDSLEPIDLFDHTRTPVLKRANRTELFSPPKLLPQTPKTPILSRITPLESEPSQLGNLEQIRLYEESPAICTPKLEVRMKRNRWLELCWSGSAEEDWMSGSIFGNIPLTDTSLIPSVETPVLKRISEKAMKEEFYQDRLAYPQESPLFDTHVMTPRRSFEPTREHTPTPIGVANAFSPQTLSEIDSTKMVDPRAALKSVINFRKLLDAFVLLLIENAPLLSEPIISSSIVEDSSIVRDSLNMKEDKYIKMTLDSILDRPLFDSLLSEFKAYPALESEYVNELERLDFLQESIKDEVPEEVKQNKENDYKVANTEILSIEEIKNSFSTQKDQDSNTQEFAQGHDASSKAPITWWTDELSTPKAPRISHPISLEPSPIFALIPEILRDDSEVRDEIEPRDEIEDDETKEMETKKDNPPDQISKLMKELLPESSSTQRDALLGPMDLVHGSDDDCDASSTSPLLQSNNYVVSGKYDQELSQNEYDDPGLTSQMFKNIRMSQYDQQLSNSKSTQEYDSAIDSNGSEIHQMQVDEIPYLPSDDALYLTEKNHTSGKNGNDSKLATSFGTPLSSYSTSTTFPVSKLKTPITFSTLDWVPSNEFMTVTGKTFATTPKGELLGKYILTEGVEGQDYLHDGEFGSTRRHSTVSDLDRMKRSSMISDVDVTRTISEPPLSSKKDLLLSRDDSGIGFYSYEGNDYANPIEFSNLKQMFGGFSTAAGKTLPIPSPLKGGFFGDDFQVSMDKQDVVESSAFSLASGNDNPILFRGFSTTTEFQSPLYANSHSASKNAGSGFALASGKELIQSTPREFPETKGYQPLIASSLNSRSLLNTPLRKAQPIFKTSLVTPLAAQRQTAPSSGIRNTPFKIPSLNSGVQRRARGLLHQNINTPTSFSVTPKPVVIKLSITYLIPEKRFPIPLKSSNLESLNVSITYENAGDFTFSLDGMIFGFEEAHSRMLAMGCIASICTLAWVQNHYKWIVWKVASMFYWLGSASVPTVPLTFENVVGELLYRYDVEVNQVKRSALKQIVERDGNSKGHMVLFVSRLAITIDGIDMELSDGWYSIRTQLDGMLKRLVKLGKVKLGQKLHIQGAVLAGSGDACPVLEMPAGLVLRISGNSCRRAPANSTLGFCKLFSFPVCLSSIIMDGGLVCRVDVLIMRIYPLVYIETKSGVKSFRSEKEEEDKKREWVINYETCYQQADLLFQKDPESFDVPGHDPHQVQQALTEWVEERIPRRSVEVSCQMLICDYPFSAELAPKCSTSLLSIYRKEGFDTDVFQEGKRYQFFNVSSGKQGSLRGYSSCSYIFLPNTNADLMRLSMYFPRALLPAFEFSALKKGDRIDTCLSIIECSLVETPVDAGCQQQVYIHRIFCTDESLVNVVIEYETDTDRTAFFKV